MADFFSALWAGVFEAGPTPALLLATNLSFAALQVVLLALLLATKSIHFIILSLLCGGLWYSINWFAVELQAAQKKEQKAERLRRISNTTVDDEGDMTEIEDDPGKSRHPMEQKTQSLDNKQISPSHDLTDLRLAQQSSPGDARLRKSYGNDLDGARLSSNASTDSEWEQVDVQE